MKKLQVLMGMVITVSLLALPVVLYAQETDPVQVCYGPAFEAFQSGEQAFDPAIWAEDATFVSVMGDMVMTYTGHEEIGAHFEEMLAKHTTMEVTVQSVEGGTVTSEDKVSDNEIQALGVAPLVGTEVCVVEDGKIQSMTWTMSDESLAALGAALAALPQTGGEVIPAQAWIAALGGLTLAAGFCARHLRRRE